MRPLISFEQAKKLDEKTIESFAMPEIILMEKAGLLCSLEIENLIQYRMKDYAEKISQKLSDTKISVGVAYNPRLILLCGSGNNGGDALVIARELFDKGYDVSIYMHKKASTESCALHTNINAKLGIPKVSKNELEDALKHANEETWIIDALAGIGLKSEYRDKDLLEMINASHALVCSIDVPSGLRENRKDGDEVVVVEADYTLSIGQDKLAMHVAEQRAYCGMIIPIEHVFPIRALRDIPVSACLLEHCDVEFLISYPHTNSYKHSRGIVALATGSKECMGAAILSTRAALRGPAGLVYALPDESIKNIVASHISSAVSGKELDSIKHLHAIVVGCGWTDHNVDELKNFLDMGLPTVLDAEALRLLAGLDPQEHYNMILTPHMGELRDLYTTLVDEGKIIADDVHAHWIEKAKCIASYYNAVVYAKHSTGIICLPKTDYIFVVESSSRGGNPSLSVGGSGDVLAGLLGSCLAHIWAGIEYDNARKEQYAFYKKNITKLFFSKEQDINISDNTFLACYATILAALLHQRAGLSMKKNQGVGDAYELLSYIDVFRTSKEDNI